MQQWEYLKRTGPNDYELQKLGNEGWELVAVASAYGNDYIFKRPKNVTISTENYQSNSGSQSYTQKKEWTMEEMFPGIGK